MECGDNAIAPFCTPFLTVEKQRSESMTLPAQRAEGEDGTRRLVLVLGSCTIVVGFVIVGDHFL